MQVDRQTDRQTDRQHEDHNTMHPSWKHSNKKWVEYSPNHDYIPLVPTLSADHELAECYNQTLDVYVPLLSHNNHKWSE